MFLPHWSGCASVHPPGPYRAARTTALVALAMALVGCAAPCRAGDAGSAKSGVDQVDTEHLFGFTEGTDIGTVGEREFESDSTLRSGKNSGSFNDAASQLEFKYTAFRNFRVSAAATFVYYDIAGVAGMDDRRQADLQSLSFNARFRLLERDYSPFGLTLSVEPHRGFADETSGVRIDHFGWEALLLADREILPDRLFAALNVHFDTDRTRVLASGAVEQAPTLGIGAAVAGKVMPAVWLGAEVRYLRSYDGAGLDVLSGQAIYIGPTFYTRLGARVLALSRFRRSSLRAGFRNSGRARSREFRTLPGQVSPRLRVLMGVARLVRSPRVKAPAAGTRRSQWKNGGRLKVIMRPHTRTATHANSDVPAMILTRSGALASAGSVLISANVPVP